MQPSHVGDKRCPRRTGRTISERKEETNRLRVLASPRAWAYVADVVAVGVLS
jgi:hypothetical protein